MSSINNIVFVLTPAFLQYPGESIQCKHYTFLLLFLKPPPVYESEDSECTDELSLSEETPVKPQELNVGPLPLSITRAR